GGGGDGEGRAAGERRGTAEARALRVSRRVCRQGAESRPRRGGCARARRGRGGRAGCAPRTQRHPLKRGIGVVFRPEPAYRRLVSAGVPDEGPGKAVRSRRDRVTVIGDETRTGPLAVRPGRRGE